MAKKATPKKKNKPAAKAKAKAKPAAKKAAKKPTAKKAKPAPKAKVKAKPAAKKAKPAPKAKAKPAKKAAKPAAKAKPASKVNPKIMERTPLKRRRRRPEKPKVPKKTPEQILQEDEATKVRISKNPLMNFRKREEVARNPAMGKVLPEEANRARYSDKELKEFHDIIIKKLEEARHELNNLQTQMLNANENGTDDTAGAFKMLEDGSENQAKEEAGQLAIRQQKFIEQLEAALGRIENQTYGICVVTGKLIPKARLRAVPHTTKSIEAKLNQYRD